MTRSFSESALSARSSTFSVELELLRPQRKLLIVDDAARDAAQLDTRDIDRGLVRLARAVRQKVFDELLQFYTVMPQYFGDLALLRRELADDFLGQKLGAFAQRGERRLQLV